MSSYKKFLLIFPPLWTIEMPYLSIPSLLAQLKKNGIDAKALDLNIDYFNYILTEDYINKTIEKLKEQFNILTQQKETFLGKNDSDENKILNYKYSVLKGIFETKNNIDKLSEYASKIMLSFKDKKYFYNYNNLIKAKTLFDYIINIHSLLYYPSCISSDFNYKNDFIELKFSDIKKVVFDKNQNMFLEFYKTKLEEIKKQEYSYIGISIGYVCQIIGGLTLANILKKETNAHINIGGSFFSRTLEGFVKNPGFFDIFADSFSYGEGENSILELAKYINNEIPIEDVPNLVYKKNQEVKINPPGKPVILSRIKPPDYSDYDLTKYFVPEPILPLQINRGCYWKKCSFCDHSYAKTYTIKKMKDLIEEIKENKEKYGVTTYYIVDESVHPKFLDRFSDALIENNIRIRFCIYSRFEKEIDYKLLKKAYKAGLRLIHWGFESGNERIHKLMNKGIVFRDRDKLIKLANKAGICNYVFCMYNFPTETYSEAMDTINFLRKNKRYIQMLGYGEFVLTIKSFIYKNYSKFNIKICNERNDFCDCSKYEVEEGMTNKEIEKIRENISKQLQYHLNKVFLNLPFWKSDYLVLYNNKYNLKQLNKIKIKSKK